MAKSAPTRPLVELLGGRASLDLRYGPCLLMQGDAGGTTLTLWYPSGGPNDEWFRTTVEREPGARADLYRITVARSLNGRPYEGYPERERVHVTRGDLAVTLATVDGRAYPDPAPQVATQEYLRELTPIRTMLNLLGGQSNLENRYGPRLRLWGDAVGLTLEYPAPDSSPEGEGAWNRLRVERERPRRGRYRIMLSQRGARPPSHTVVSERRDVTGPQLAAAVADMDGMDAGAAAGRRAFADSFSLVLEKLAGAEERYADAQADACRALELPSTARVINLTDRSWEHRPSPLPNVSDTVTVDSNPPGVRYVYWVVRTHSKPLVRGPYTVWSAHLDITQMEEAVWLVTRTELQQDAPAGIIRPVGPNEPDTPPTPMMFLSSNLAQLATVSRVTPEAARAAAEQWDLGRRPARPAPVSRGGSRPATKVRGTS